MFDVQGRICLETKLSTNNKIDTSFLSKGLYVIELINDKKSTFRKLIKQ